MLSFIIFPITVVINLVLLSSLSILEKSALGLQFLISSTAIGEMASIILWIYLKYDLSYVFVAHVLTIM